jgi:hypothetical protein
MQSCGEFFGEQRMHGPMSLDAGFSRECGRYNADAKMRFAPVRRSAIMRDMTGVFVRFVDDLNLSRSKSRLQLRFHAFAETDRHCFTSPSFSRQFRKSTGFNLVIVLDRPCRRRQPSHIVSNMNLNSPFFDRIRTQREAKTETVGASGPMCAHPGCQATGEFRAPMGRLREGQYFCFCLDHVREYNATYNYFHGMSDEDVLRYQKDAVTGHRPTWRMAANRAGVAASGLHEPFHPQGAKPGKNRTPKHGVVARKALHALGLDDDAGTAEIKTRYKELVKRLHPDANGGDRSNEERLREIINAYNVLRSFRAV